MKRSDFLVKCQEYNENLKRVSEKKMTKREIMANAMDYVVADEVVAVAEMAGVRGYLHPAYEPQRESLQSAIRRIDLEDFTQDVFEGVVTYLAEPEDDGSYRIFELGGRYAALEDALKSEMGNR